MIFLFLLLVRIMIATDYCKIDHYLQIFCETTASINESTETKY